MMKALVYKKYGQPETVFQLQELDKPIPKAKEIRVQVHYTTVNRTDEGTITARYVVSRLYSGLFSPKRIVPGTDFSGIVEAVGSEVTAFKVGDHVFGFNDEGASSQAEYLCIPETGSVSLTPSNSSLKQVVACLEGVHYAFNFINKVHPSKDHKVLVYGATGAIGSAAVQLLKYYGCYVVAVCNTKNVGLIQSLGVDRVIDYEKEDFTQDKERFDFVCDAVGKSSFATCKPLLTPKGIYVSSELGTRGINLFLALLSPFFRGKKVLFPIPKALKKSIAFIKKLIEQEQFTPVIDRVYDFEDIIEAYTYVQTGQKTGNVVIKIHSSAQ